MPQFLLITGGTRSGKSRFAVELAQRVDRRIVYLATCRVADQEMKRRVARHQRQRPAHWTTLAHPPDPATAITRLNGTAGGVIIDCLTMYVSERLMRGDSDAAIIRQVRRLCGAIRRAAIPVIMVTNEVGAGVVPEPPLGRRFRDLAGLANQLAAQQADQVVLMVAGIPLWIKGGGQWRAERNAPTRVVHSPDRRR